MSKETPIPPDYRHDSALAKVADLSNRLDFCCGQLNELKKILEPVLGDNFNKQCEVAGECKKESALPPLSQSILNETQKIINFSNALQDLMDRIAL